MRSKVSFAGRRNGKTWTEALSDKAIPVRTVAEIKANYANASDERIAEVYSQVWDQSPLSQTETARNLRRAFLEMRNERNIKVKW